MAATREDWLLQAGRHTAAILSEATGLVVPEHYVSVGFPKGARSRWKALGQCWDGARSRDKRPHLFVSPIVSDVPQVLAVLLHEQIHAAVGPEAGHRGEFARAARAVGLARPWSKTLMGKELFARVHALRDTVGPYPHAPLKQRKHERPGSRYRLWECACGVKARVASDSFEAHCDRCGSAFLRPRA
jgi:hypothetical protein